MLFMAFGVHAQSDTVLNNKNFSKKNFIDSLTPKASELQTRSFSVASVGQPISQPPSANLQITFTNGSAMLTSASKNLLDQVAAVIHDDLKGFMFEINGHTDVTGQPQKNIELSERRAKSVVAYLEIKHGIDGRLSAVGKGSSELLIATKPTSPSNRRVTFINKGLADNE